MVENGVREKRVRRYRVAVYSQCGSFRDVDVAFDALAEAMLSDRREDYLWGVLLDYAPSPLFRTFGDYETEERVRERFSEICSLYPECGFFSILRGRRYCGSGGFRCENGISGAVKALMSGKSDGCSVRLSTGDTPEHSERVFLWDIRGGSVFPLMPCDITRSSLHGGSVAVSRGGCSEKRVKQYFADSLKRDYRRNYRVCGWLSFPSAPAEEVSVYRCFSVPKRRRGGGDVGLNSEKAFHCVKRFFLLENGSFSVSLLTDICNTDELAAAVFACVSLWGMGAVDAVNLRETLFFLTNSTLTKGCSGDGASAGFLRIALLVGAEFCDGMGECGEEFFQLAANMRAIAERLRVEYECGALPSPAPFLPCEMLAFRVSGENCASYFGGFTALKRLCDRFLYLFSDRRSDLRGILNWLLSAGIDENGLLGDKDRFIRNALLLSVSAQLCNGSFSRIAARIPELRACARLFEALP